MAGSLGEVGWVYLLVAALAIGLVFWDVFIRDRRGAALVWSLAGGITLVCAGVAKGFGVDGAAPLLGLILGLGLCGVGELAQRRDRRGDPRARAV